MATRLSKASIERAIDHIAAFGDTDVFPHPIETAFLTEKRNEIAAELSVLDLDGFQPAQSIETIAPKSRWGFRIVHQLPLLETILYTAAAIEIGPDIENVKRPIDEFGPFGYRFDGVGSDGSLFVSDRSYKHWLAWQRKQLKQAQYSHVVATDIADFYQRIYFHRIENILDVATQRKGVKFFIEKLIKRIRGKQSYGIPVGGSASRIIAEATLTDADSALANEEFIFTRFVDDYRIFLTEDQPPYVVLAFLAEQLATNEGLSLNAQKTKVWTIAEFERELDSQEDDVFDKAQQAAIEALTQSLYFDEDPDPDEIEKIRALNLVEMLEEELAEDLWDFGKIRLIFRGLRLTADADALKVIIERFDDLLPFVKEFVLFVDALHKADKAIGEEIAREVLRLLETGAATSVPTIQVWLLELFVRGCFGIDHKHLTKAVTGHTLTQRQSFIVRGLNGDVNFFRRNKTRFEELNGFEKHHFMIGATCLPKDEFVNWIGAVRSNLDRPLDARFCDWVKTKTGDLKNIVEARNRP
ncbi:MULTISPECIES: RNA-directed DNA polymerase [unclassified Bradyrhizobium]|uniref:RNA-directed DNA polymerase n=1 Tax=unclassified Bradyrhizobium TaxID=2631580 RepID=UPI0028EE3BA0|nr:MULTISPECIES: RNA-directed DNA polymerase [unclassified Bradyrhizobium]